MVHIRVDGSDAGRAAAKIDAAIAQLPAKASKVIGLGTHSGGNLIVSSSGFSAVESVHATGGSTIAADRTI